MIEQEPGAALTCDDSRRFWPLCFLGRAAIPHQAALRSYGCPLLDVQSKVWLMCRQIHLQECEHATGEPKMRHEPSILLF